MSCHQCWNVGTTAPFDTLQKWVTLQKGGSASLIVRVNVTLYVDVILRNVDICTLHILESLKCNLDIFFGKIHIKEVLRSAQQSDRGIQVKMNCGFQKPTLPYLIPSLCVVVQHDSDSVLDGTSCHQGPERPPGLWGLIPGWGHQCTLHNTKAQNQGTIPRYNTRLEYRGTIPEWGQSNALHYGSLGLQH